MPTARPRGAAWRGWCGVVLCCAALLAAAGERMESRGAHTRSDHPDLDAAFRHRLVLR